MKTEPGGMSSRSPSFLLDMDGPSSLMRTVKLGEDGYGAMPKKQGPSVRVVRVVPGQA